ncbi:hypothetical protein EV421DRAFT_1729454 [Armillaria borealis]|uniref:Uncharacterized protein n=1 Tax=Armillaria borealis TaxID=47425 RepID=A0AA39KBI0_9AGAR|nr:hypothetical protein EV421DRAFT_1729454 [Armillaria borealis]
MQTIPISTSTSGTWAVDKAVVEKWKDLEALLQCFRTVLEECFVSHRNIGYVSFPLPWKYSYHHAKRGQNTMAHAAMRSQDAFIIMAAKISYLLVITENSAHTGKSGNWVDLICSSWIVQQDVGLWEGNECQALRAGMFINVCMCNFVHFLHAYDRWHVPLWIDWGTLDMPYEASNSRVETHSPLPMSEVQGICRLGEEDTKSMDVNWKQRCGYRIFVSTSKSMVADNIDITTDRGGELKVTIEQQPGETWQCFFRRRDLEMDNILRVKSVHILQSCHASPSCAEKQYLYPHTGTSVFYWRHSSDGGSVCLRILPASIPIYWARYLPSQRWYSPFWDQWDLNSEFDTDSSQNVLNIGEIDDFCEDGKICRPSEGPEPGVKDHTAKEWDMVHNKIHPPVLDTVKLKSASDNLVWRRETNRIVPIAASVSNVLDTSHVTHDMPVLDAIITLITELLSPISSSLSTSAASLSSMPLFRIPEPQNIGRHAKETCFALQSWD